MTDTEKTKIVRFLNDESMSNAVHEVLLRSFLKPSALADVNMLAASRIAIDLLEDAWKELGKYKSQEKRDVQAGTNVGL